jgi:hypothetical protein
MRRSAIVLGSFVTVVGALLAVPADATDDSAARESQRFVVLYADGTSAKAGQQAVTAAGGTIRTENAAIGFAEVVSANPAFLKDVRAQDAVKAAARDRSFATSRPGMAPKYADERLDTERVMKRLETGSRVKPTPGTDPLTGYQWDMEMIGAQNEDGSPALEERGDGVLVGIIDTGIDGNHPDIAPNFSNALSRNFTVDMPDIDGPCEYVGCVDPANVDGDGHGTHVAGTVASPINAVGISGVAPEATLVNIRAGQDSGYFFLGPTLDALTYAADIGIDVVNMSFYVDPWLYNCDSADDYVAGEVSDADIAEQAFTRRLVSNALQYAHDRGVTLVAASGNEHADLAAAQRFDAFSPGPTGGTQGRLVSKDCIDLPSEGPHVLNVSSVGPSGTKADYSNYGLDEIDLAAPGGWVRDLVGTPD